MTSTSSIVNVELDSRIEALDKNLDALRLNFTELHPDIISTKRLIAQLEERKKGRSEADQSLALIREKIIVPCCNSSMWL